MLLLRTLPLLALTLLTPPAHANLGVSPTSLFSILKEPPEGLNGELSAGLSLMGGNTRTERYEFRNRTSYRWEKDTVQGQLRYLRASAKDVENANSWGVGARHERRLKHHLGTFEGHTLESDRFAGYRQRHSTDLGLRRVVWAKERTVGTLEAGYRHQYEKYTDGTSRISPIARLFSEVLYRWNTTAFGLFSLEFLPDVRNLENWMLNGEASLESAITERIAWKTSFAFRFDHQPPEPGLQKLDRSLTSSIVARF